MRIPKGLERDIVEYIRRNRPFRSTFPEARAVVATGPVEGSVGYVAQAALPESFAEVPHIPERIRLFAFRYATEYRTQKDWAEIYNVGISTIVRWLHSRGVNQYVALLRTHRRLLVAASFLQMEELWAKGVFEALNAPVSDDNLAAKVSLLKWVEEVLEKHHTRRPSPAGIPPAPSGGFPSDELGAAPTPESIAVKVKEQMRIVAELRTMGMPDV